MGTWIISFMSHKTLIEQRFDKKIMSLSEELMSGFKM